MYSSLSPLRLLALSALALLFFACQQEQLTENGFPYQLVKKGEGKAVEYGNYVYTHFAIHAGDSILYQTQEEEGQRVLLRDTTYGSLKKRDPVLDVLPLMQVGDSAIVKVEVDDIIRLDGQFKDLDYFYYHVVVKKVETKEERRAEEAKVTAKRAKTNAAELKTRTEQLEQTQEGSVFFEQLKTLQKNYSTHPDLKTSDSGLSYIILKEGEAKRCQSGNKVIVHYIGITADQNVFDETFTRDQAFAFALDRGRVIKAWDEAIQLIGEQGEIFIKAPANLAYGATGYPPIIKANEDLFFYIKVVKQEEQ